MSKIIILAYLEEDEVVLKKINPVAEELKKATEGMDIEDYVVMGGDISDFMTEQMFGNGEEGLPAEEIERRFKAYLKQSILSMQKNKVLRKTS